MLLDHLLCRFGFIKIQPPVTVASACNWWLNLYFAFAYLISASFSIQAAPKREQYQLIVHANVEYTPDEQPLLALYLCPARTTIDLASTEGINIVEYAVRLTYSTSVPFSKLVVRYAEDQTHLAAYGEVINPVENDHSVGTINPNDFQTLYCDPEPKDIAVHYWESKITDKQLVIPAFHCLLYKGQGYIADVDYTNRLPSRRTDEGYGMAYQEVAHLDIVDNPNHRKERAKPESFQQFVYGRQIGELQEASPRF